MQDSITKRNFTALALNRPWLPAAIFAAAMLFGVFSNIVLLAFYEAGTPPVTALGVFNGFLTMIALILMFSTGFYQLRHKMYRRGLINLIAPVVIFIVVGLLGVAIT